MRLLGVQVLRMNGACLDAGRFEAWRFQACRFQACRFNVAPLSR
jgi:hypothetical protein